MKVCKVKPRINTCMVCLDAQSLSGVIKDCAKCYHCKQDYDILGVGVNLFGTPWAIVVRKGRAEKVPLNRVFCIREANNE